MYSPVLTTSTAIHAHHCSTYFRASIHMPMMLMAVVKESSQGTLLSVKFTNIHAMPKRAAANMTVSGSR